MISHNVSRKQGHLAARSYRERATDGDIGASLILALAFLMAISVMLASLLVYASVGARTVKDFRAERTERYAADAALESGIAWAKGQPTVGLDDPSSTPCAMQAPATGTAPAMLVTCEVEGGSGSGLPTEVGSVPEYSILTLGQRDLEAPSLRGSSCIGETGNKGWDPTGVRGSNRTEYGIRFSKTTTVCVATRSVNAWGVQGNVFTNSPILTNAGGSFTTDGVGGTVYARGGCQPAVSGCSAQPRVYQDPMVPTGNTNEGQDPRTDATATATERASWALPDLTGLPKRSVPACGTSNVVVFEPGWYDDAAAMNALFRDCKGKTFWFAPARGSDGELLGTAYKQGLYYFDFQPNWNGGCNWYNDSADSKTVWCVGDSYDTNSKVVGGTPLGWSPFATTSTSTVELTQSQLASWETSLIWSNPGRATTIDNSSASYTNSILAIDRNLTLQNFTPKVPSGAYNSTAFNVKVAHNVPNGLTPKITVRYDSNLFGSRTCGTYTLPGGNHIAPNAPAELSAADQLSLARCLNHGDKINTVKIRYTLTGCNFFCSAGTAYLDGMTLVPDSYPSQPTFPEAASCDETKPGVQFIFGGSTHLYVADGDFHVCAGPAAQNTLTSQQIAIYGVPAVTPIRPNSVTQGGANTVDTWDEANAQRIAEQVSPVSNTTQDRGSTAKVRYSGGNCGFCSPTIEGHINLGYPGTTLPAGTSVSRVTVRASYNSHGIITGPDLTINCASGTHHIDFPASHGIPQIDGNTQQSRDVPTSCLNTSRISSGFSATWKARGLYVCAFGICGQRDFTDDLDGLEFLVELTSNTASASSSPVAVPAKGCVVGAPNYWGADQGGDGSCAIIQADQTKNPFTPSQNSRGRFSARGTVYVPTGAVSIDDEDVNYPFFQRGLVARTLMFRGFRYRTPQPISQIPPIDRTQRPREVTFKVCVRPGMVPTDVRPCGSVSGDRVLTRAKVRYEVDRTPQGSGGPDPRFAAVVPKVVWWASDR